MHPYHAAPLDLETIIQRVKSGSYADVHAFESDLNTVFHNAQVCPSGSLRKAAHM